MKRKRRNSKSIVATLFLAGIITSSAYAFTASVNFTGGSHAGDGVTAIADENVTATYTLDAADPTKISKVNLAFVAPVPSITGTIKVSVVSPVSWQACVNLTATTWSCTYPVATEPTLVNAVSLRVVQAD